MEDSRLLKARSCASGKKAVLIGALTAGLVGAICTAAMDAIVVARSPTGEGTALDWWLGIGWEVILTPLYILCKVLGVHWREYSSLAIPWPYLLCASAMNGFLLAPVGVLAGCVVRSITKGKAVPHE